MWKLVFSSSFFGLGIAKIFIPLFGIIPLILFIILLSIILVANGQQKKDSLFFRVANSWYFLIFSFIFSAFALIVSAELNRVAVRALVSEARQQNSVYPNYQSESTYRVPQNDTRNSVPPSAPQNYNPFGGGLYEQRVHHAWITARSRSPQFGVICVAANINRDNNHTVGIVYVGNERASYLFIEGRSAPASALSVQIDRFPRRSLYVSRRGWTSDSSFLAFFPLPSEIIGEFSAGSFMSVDGYSITLRGSSAAYETFRRCTNT